MHCVDICSCVDRLCDVLTCLCVLTGCEMCCDKMRDVLTCVFMRHVDICSCVDRP